MTRRLVLPVAAVFGAALIAWAFPPFHVVPLDQARELRDEANFDAARFAERFWAEQLKPALPRAADAQTVLDVIDRDFPAAREKYGRTVGISNSYDIFIQGIGRVVHVDSKTVGLAVRKDSAGPDVVLPIGMVFGNTVRDATGLLNMDHFPNSQHFNDLSAALNRIVETRVLPGLRDQARVGRIVRFAGCADVGRGARQRKPLKVVPVSVEFLQP
jgi:predicted lipoprotein